MSQNNTRVRALIFSIALFCVSMAGGQTAQAGREATVSGFVDWEAEDLNGRWLLSEVNGFYQGPRVTADGGGGWIWNPPYLGNGLGCEHPTW